MSTARVESIDLSRWAEGLQWYSQWIFAQNPTVARRWHSRRYSSDSEAIEGAVIEALTAYLLSSRVESIVLHEDPATGGPDFECSVNANSFYVEATCISRDAVTKETALPDSEYNGPQFIGALTKRIRDEAAQKARTNGLDKPLVVAVGTLHRRASKSCICENQIEELLTGRSRIGGNLDASTGEAIGKPYTFADQSRAAFTKNRSFSPIRRNISAILACGFGFALPQKKVLGVLNHSANHPFNPAWLPDIPFAQFRKFPPEEYAEIDWVNHPSREQDSLSAAGFFS